jgi:hypothetical protein
MGEERDAGAEASRSLHWGRLGADNRLRRREADRRKADMESMLMPMIETGTPLLMALDVLVLPPSEGGVEPHKR